MPDPAQQPPAPMPLPPERRGACPTLAKPMQTGDGLLARLRPLGNRLTPTELRLLAEAAAELGNGIIEITARGSLQVRGLRPETVAPFEAAVLGSGIETSTGLVETPPLAGFDPGELIDMQPFAEALRLAVQEHAPPLALAPKLAVTLDGGGMFHLGGMAADVKAEAFRDGDGTRVLLLVGGRAFGVADQGQLVESIVSVLERIAAIGATARGRDVRFQEIARPVLPRTAAPLVGVFSLKADVGDCGSPPCVLPDISPTRGEIGWGADFTPPAYGDDEGAGADSSQWIIGEPALVGDSATSHSPPSWGRCPAGQRGVSPDEAQDQLPAPKKQDANFALGLAFPYCQATTQMLITLTDAASAHGAFEIRLAPSHGLFITGLTQRQAGDLQQLAATSGFVTEPDDPRRTIAVCAGSRGCASAFYDTHALAAKLQAHAPGLLDGSVAVHLSGCAKGCAHPAAAPLAFVGAREGYGLVVNGAASSGPAIYISENDIDVALQRLQALVRQRKEGAETARACLDRLGEGAIVAALQLDKT